MRQERIMAALAALMAAGVAGCGGDDCKPLTGLYEVALVERSGTCGPAGPPTRLVADGGRGEALAPGCSGTRVASKDMCSVDIDQVCDIYDELTGEFLGTMSQVGSITQVDGADRVEGTVDIELVDEFGFCSGTYDIVYTRI